MYNRNQISIQKLRCGDNKLLLTSPDDPEICIKKVIQSFQSIITQRNLKIEINKDEIVQIN